MVNVDELLKAKGPAREHEILGQIVPPNLAFFHTVIKTSVCAESMDEMRAFNRILPEYKQQYCFDRIFPF